MTTNDDDYRNFTTRIKNSTYRRLRMLAASSDKTISEMLTDLIESAMPDSPEEVATIKSLLYGASNKEEPDAMADKEKKPQRKDKISKAELKKIQDERKKEAKYNLD